MRRVAFAAALAAVVITAIVLLIPRGGPAAPSIPASDVSYEATSRSLTSAGEIQRVVRPAPAPEEPSSDTRGSAGIDALLKALERFPPDSLGSLAIDEDLLFSAMYYVHKHKLTAAHIDAALEGVPKNDPRGWRLLIAMAMAPGFSTEHQAKVAVAVTQDFGPDLGQPFTRSTTALAAAQCLRLQGVLSEDTRVIAAVRAVAPSDSRPRWKSQIARIAAEFILDGAKRDGTPSDLVDLARCSLGMATPTLLAAAWRVLDDQPGDPAFGRMATVLLQHGEGERLALSSTRNPAHEPALAQFLPGSFEQHAPEPQTTSRALIGLMRINTATSIQSVIDFVNGKAGADKMRVEMTVSRIAGSSDLDLVALPGLFQVHAAATGELGKAIGEAVESTLGKLHGMCGLRMTPIRRKELRAALLQSLESQATPDSAAAMMFHLMGRVGTFEDIEVLEKLGKRREVGGAAETAVGMIYSRTPDQIQFH